MPHRPLSVPPSGGSLEIGNQEDRSIERLIH